MTDLLRDIGRLEARQHSTDERLDSTDERLPRIENKVDAGFETVHRRLDQLMAVEKQRKGTIAVIAAIGAVQGVESEPGTRRRAHHLPQLRRAMRLAANWQTNGRWTGSSDIAPPRYLPHSLRAVRHASVTSVSDERACRGGSAEILQLGTATFFKAFRQPQILKRPEP